VIVRGNGDPLYTLVNPVDDSLMEITHVLRGEDLLPSTPRQIVLYERTAAIGVGSGRTPIFGHLPTVLGEGNRRLSKRDRGSGLAEYQQQGYLPRACSTTWPCSAGRSPRTATSSGSPRWWRPSTSCG
jgi:glutamyl-tRNA synthetase